MSFGAYPYLNLPPASSWLELKKTKQNSFGVVVAKTFPGFLQDTDVKSGCARVLE